MPRTRADVYAESNAGLAEEQLQKLLDAFDKRMQRLNEQYLRLMGEHIRAIGEMWPSDVHRLEQLRRMNKTLSRLQRMIAREAGGSMEDIRKIFEHMADIDSRMALKILGQADVNVVTDNSYLRRILEAQYRETAGAMKNLSNTTVVSDRYRSAIDEAVSAVQNGTEDYGSAIRRVIREAGSGGLQLKYESGYHRRLDTAARMNVLDGARHINQNIMNALGEKFGADGVEIDAHMLCAEDHLPYQGGQYTNAEFDEIQGSLMRPFGEWNCRHSWHPILMGISPPTYTGEQLREMREYSTEQIEIDGKTKTRYQWSQEMRRIETAVRQQKDTAILAQASGDRQLRSECQGNVLRLQQLYRNVSKQSGLKTEFGRTYVAGFKDVREAAGLTGSENSGKITSGAARKFVIGGIKTESMPQEQLTKIVSGFARNGGYIQMNKETDAYLRKRGVEGITYNSTTILLSSAPTRAAVFEELIHATQWRTGELVDDPISMATAEIKAKEKLLKHAKAYQLTDGDIYITQQLLQSDIAHLEQLKRGDDNG